MTDELAELPSSLEWVNTDASPTLLEARGQVVVLFFWTYSNLNSILALKILKQLENRFDNGVVTFGVHCPKFGAEEYSGNVLKAINRHFVRFPVAIDNGFDAWRYFGVEGWPSFVVIDAIGRVDSVLMGDNVEEDLSNAVEKCVDRAQAEGMLRMSRARVAHKPEPATVLRFPAAVLEARGMLYVADTANNRIVELSKSGAITRVFGSGNPGHWDGKDENAGFDTPRGLAYAENWLYVADSNNHSIRRINLFNGDVETVLGMGKDVLRLTSSGRNMLEFGVRYPVGMSFDGAHLYVACAGMNQVWRIDLGRGTAGWFSGSGQCGLVDGEAVRSAFAQPLGVAVASNYVYVVDADGSAVREVRIQTGHVHTRVGHGTFSFGHADGTQGQALLQYPTAIATRPRATDVWIADGMNNMIRQLDLRTGELTTLKIDHPLNFPTSICLAGNTLWIANTNAHEIVRFDITEKTAQPLLIATPDK